MKKASLIVLKIAFLISVLMNIILIIFLLVNPLLWNDDAIYNPESSDLMSNRSQYCSNAAHLKKNIIDSGNIESYSDLLLLYMEAGEAGEFLPYAIIMANKWHKPQGYLDVYVELTDLYGCGISDSIEIMDTASRNMALNYLIQGYVLATDSSLKEFMHTTILMYYDNGRFITKNENGYVVIN